MDGRTSRAERNRTTAPVEGRSTLPLGDDSSEPGEAGAVPAGRDRQRPNPAAEPTRGVASDVAAGTAAGPGSARDPRRSIPALSGYEILGELGRGGMGVVYQARQIGLNRPCALKMILAGAHATPQAVARFLGEAEAIAKLQHRHIVQIYAIGEVEGLPFFELEYLPGGGLDKQLDGTPWVPERAASLVEILARAIAEAHRLGIVHRDLKPANILLAVDGTPKITDFGLAKAIGSESDQTRSNAIMGSPSYMAPEQAGGNTKQAGPAADIYALGVVLYELLTGRPPFRGATILETIEQVKKSEPVPPSRLVPNLPRDLETICLKCLEKDPAQRYEDAQALAEDLKRFQADEPILARPIGTAERAWRWCRRNRLVASLAGGIAVAMVLGTLVATYFALRATRGERLASRKAQEALANAERAGEQTLRANLAADEAAAETRRADQEARNAVKEAQHAREEKQLGDRRLYVAEINLAQQAWEKGRVDLMQQHLQALVPTRREDPDLRGFEWYYQDQLRQSDLRTLSGHAGVVHGVAISPDGRLIASSSGDQTVKLWETATGREIRTLKGHTRVADRVAFSPDGRTLASSSWDGTIKLWNVAKGTEVRTLRVHNYNVRGLAYSPDGRILASSVDDGIIKLWDTTTGQEIRTLGEPSPGIVSVAFSRDGQTLAAACSDHSIKLWEVGSGRLLRSLSGHTGPVWGVAFDPDGRRLASSSFDDTVKLWDTGTWREIFTLRGHRGDVRGVAFSPDGRRLASASMDHTVKLWETATGEEILTLRGHTAAASNVAFNPVGRTIASASWDGTVKVWDVSTDHEAVFLRGHTGPVKGVAFSPDGRRIASASEDKTIRLWDAATGQARLALRGHTGAIKHVAFSPDGRALASVSDQFGADAEKVVRLWDVATGRATLTLIGHTAPVAAVAFGPDGQTLASASDDKTVRFWEAVTGREIRIWRGGNEGFGRLALSPDGRRLVLSSNSTVSLRDAETGQEVKLLTRLREQGCSALAFSPDGRTVAVALISMAITGDQMIQLWDTASGQEVLKLCGHSDRVFAVAFSPDGRRLASTCMDGSVWLWDVATGKAVLSLQGHARGVETVSFSPDGRKLVIGDQAALKLWDATPLTPELRDLREARDVVEFLSTKSLSKDEVLARIARDPTLSEPVRRFALDLARQALVI